MCCVCLLGLLKSQRTWSTLAGGFTSRAAGFIRMWQRICVRVTAYLCAGIMSYRARRRTVRPDSLWSDRVHSTRRARFLFIYFNYLNKSVFSVVNSTINMTLPTFAAKRPVLRRCCCWAPGAADADRYLLLAGHSAANLPHAAAVK